MMEEDDDRFEAALTAVIAGKSAPPELEHDDLEALGVAGRLIALRADVAPAVDAPWLATSTSDTSPPAEPPRATGRILGQGRSRWDWAVAAAVAGVALAALLWFGNRSGFGPMSSAATETATPGIGEGPAQSELNVAKTPDAMADTAVPASGRIVYWKKGESDFPLFRPLESQSALTSFDVRSGEEKVLWPQSAGGSLPSSTAGTRMVAVLDAATRLRAALGMSWTSQNDGTGTKAGEPLAPNWDTDGQFVYMGAETREMAPGIMESIASSFTLRRAVVTDKAHPVESLFRLEKEQLPGWNVVLVSVHEPSSRIAITTQLCCGGGYEGLWIHDLSTGAALRHFEGRLGKLDVSSDGRRLAYIECAGDGCDSVAVKLVDVTEDQQSVLAFLPPERGPSSESKWNWTVTFSQDGRWLAYPTCREHLCDAEEVDLAILDVASGQHWNLPDTTVRSTFRQLVTFSPDGRWLAGYDDVGERSVGARWTGNDWVPVVWPFDTIPNDWVDLFVPGTPWRLHRSGALRNMATGATAPSPLLPDRPTVCCWNGAITSIFDGRWIAWLPETIDDGSTVSRTPFPSVTPEAYPPPKPPDAAIEPTPVLGADGYYSEPADRWTRWIAPEDSRFAALLTDLQRRLGSRDVTRLAGLVNDSVDVMPVGATDMGMRLNRAQIEQLLVELFASGDTPRLQAYMASRHPESGYLCAEVFVSPWTGKAHLPPIATPAPSEVSLGEQPPDLIDSRDHVWEFCGGSDGGVFWRAWRWGSNWDLIQGLQDHVSLEDASLYLLRPAAMLTPTGPIADPKLPEVLSTFPDSPDGAWRVRRFEAQRDETSMDDDWPSRMVVERVDGSAVSWLASAEMNSVGICEGAKEPLGWSADSLYLFFGHLPCYEGCTRFADPSDIVQLDLKTGARRSVPSGVLSPDGRFIAATSFHDTAWWLDVVGLGPTVTHTWTRIQGVPMGEQLAVGGVVWSSDARFLAVTEMEGACRDELASAIHVFKRSSPGREWTSQILEHRGRIVPDGTLLAAVEMDELGRVLVKPASGSDDRTLGTWWWRDPAQNAYVPDRRPATPPSVP